MVKTISKVIRIEKQSNKNRKIAIKQNIMMLKILFQQGNIEAITLHYTEKKLFQRKFLRLKKMAKK